MDMDRAKDFCRSYGDAMASGKAGALADHYGFPYVSFTGGYISRFEDRAEADAMVQAHLDRFQRSGLGLDIRLADYRVEPVSGTGALCHLRWEIHPEKGEGWAWDNVYGLRQTADGQHFEFNVSDNEFGELLARYPDFMSV
ncbi:MULTISPECIES: hypothetical protein [Sphingomonadales]|uniref:SnoaL-like domain-containing protein n=1 Tax=Edaphosphingomonas haloaromaticamans TaxID=653954 RepID=A0A1S1HG02_9SPHN|nr:MULTISPECIES: hypothetical protein [Sphingomonas]AGH48290.1 hypothetical protein G432_02815 [Sphingomonas sp. MM-1]MDX3883475.1 hypothetical protein [Sphingomonas sp.]OHT20762.1 hypothetical protein BHE75_02764 [Sphingomonas haloaromaticamans]